MHMFFVKFLRSSTHAWMLYLPQAWTRLELHGYVTKKHLSTAHLLYVPRLCAAKECQSHLPKQAFSTYYQKWIIICVYLVIVKRAYATSKAGIKNEISTSYQVFSNFITVTLIHSICQKQVISPRILRRCIQVKKRERRLSSCVHVTQTGQLYQTQWEWNF